MSLNYTMQCINASAGSGKTTYIVNQIIQEAEKYHSLDHILCLTFSNAAVKELMQRIFHANQQMERPCKWNHKLAQTLHAFCLILLRSHNPHYQILTSHMQSILWKKSLNDCAAQLEHLSYQQLRQLSNYNISSQLPDELLLSHTLIYEQFMHYKTYESLISFDEIISHTQNLIIKDMLNDALFANLSNIRCLYIDESQDLSDSQWEIINALLNEIIQINPLKVILVGDKMQSIYSFQGANPRSFEIFQDVHKDIHSMHNSQGYSQENMSSSYRCGKNVTQLVNSVFNLQQTSLSQIQDSIEFWQTYDDWADKICEKIKQLLSMTASDITQQIYPQDIIILIRKRHAKYSHLTQKLKDAGMPVIYDEYKEICKSILDIITTLQTSADSIFDYNITGISITFEEFISLHAIKNNPLIMIQTALRYMQLPHNTQNTILHNLSNFFQAHGANMHSCMLFFQNISNLEVSYTRSIHIQTIHATKGMEASVIFLCDTMQNPNFSAVDTSAHSDKEHTRKNAIAEHKRLLYVALTRAKKLLIIVNNPEKYKLSDDSWHNMISAHLPRCD